MGPCLVAHGLIGDPSKLHLTTRINGDVRQDESVSDLLFDCAYLIEYLSQGTTLQKGSVIMTGTPGGMYALEQPTATHSTKIMARYLGVGNGMKPPQFLTPGTVMEVTVSKIGTLRNGVEFA
jgi:2-keto-4-pentenoate hydratase/2-oxohepta-3-ene-1,7-dioic acid hydratase in catechol pathway